MSSTPPAKVVKPQSIPTERRADGTVIVPLPDYLTDEEKNKLKELRDRVTAACPEKNIHESYRNPVDYDILRFLRARKWVVDDSFAMIMNTLAWRTENRPDTITEEDIESENKKGKVYFQNYDYEGRLIAWIRVRLHKKSDSDFEVLKKLCMYWMEQGFKNIRPDVPATCVLFDMRDFGLSNMDYSYVKFIIDMFANHYPDTLGTAIVVNSPWIFKPCWALIKPWLDPVTATKIVFMTDKELANIIPPENLPVDLGGESTFDWAATYVPVADRLQAESSPSKTEDSLTTSSTSASEKKKSQKSKQNKIIESNEVQPMLEKEVEVEE